MSPEGRAAIERVVERRTELGPSDFAAYAFLAFGILAGNAPDVLMFILDRTDERVLP
jgi:hypothetical protein